MLQFTRVGGLERFMEGVRRRGPPHRIRIRVTRGAADRCRRKTKEEEQRPQEAQVGRRWSLAWEGMATREMRRTRIPLIAPVYYPPRVLPPPVPPHTQASLSLKVDNTAHPAETLPAARAGLPTRRGPGVAAQHPWKYPHHRCIRAIAASASRSPPPRAYTPATVGKRAALASILVAFRIRTRHNASSTSPQRPAYNSQAALAGSEDARTISDSACGCRVASASAASTSSTRSPHDCTVHHHARCIHIHSLSLLHLPPDPQPPGQRLTSLPSTMRHTPPASTCTERRVLHFTTRTPASTSTARHARSDTTPEPAACPLSTSRVRSREARDMIAAAAARVRSAATTLRSSISPQRPPFSTSAVYLRNAQREEGEGEEWEVHDAGEEWGNGRRRRNEEWVGKQEGGSGDGGKGTREWRGRRSAGKGGRREGGPGGGTAARSAGSSSREEERGQRRHGRGERGREGADAGRKGGREGTREALAGKGRGAAARED
ncbi:hypothetical protein DFH09DRAFT_1400708 [Mycena vulgaris]|nr:hypothetical protein DFH09DRAFT_1400708 [Mycena vulgaris]